MKFLFIWPNRGTFNFKPIGIALLSAIMKRKGHEVELFDTTFVDFGFEAISKVRFRIRVFKPVDYGELDVEKKKVDWKAQLIQKLDEFQPDVVGVSALFDEVEIGLEASRATKQWRDVPVIWGNKAATMDPERLLTDGSVDFVCVGEGIEFISEFMDCLSSGGDPRVLKNIAYLDDAGRVRRNELHGYFQKLDSLPYVDWSIFDPRQFLKPFDGRVYVGGDHMIYWGCCNDCTYCINHAYRSMYGPKAGRFLRGYSVDRIIEELKHVVQKWNLTFLKFHDEDFCIKPKSYFRELAEKYERHIGLPFTIEANARNLTKEKVGLLKRMNCASVSIGIENGNTHLRKDILKRRESKEEIIRAVGMLNDAQIRTSSFNLIGIPFEDRSTILDTIKLNRDAGVRYPNVGFFFPLEGTDLREIAIRNGFFDDSHGAVFDDLHPILHFSEISGEELVALRERFTLYVKMPKEYYKYIERSERPDEIGLKLTEEIHKIYDECVFLNEGVWTDRGKNRNYLHRLEQIYQTADGTTMC